MYISVIVLYTYIIFKKVHGVVCIGFRGKLVKGKPEMQGN
jgi:hypothetical protein